MELEPRCVHLCVQALGLCLRLGYFMLWFSRAHSPQLPKGRREWGRWWPRGVQKESQEGQAGLAFGLPGDTLLTQKARNQS